jgi:hypothetical protein
MAIYLYAVVPWPLLPARAAAPARTTKKTNAPAGRGGRSRKALAAAPAPEVTHAHAPDLGAGVGVPPRAIEALVYEDLAALVSAVAPGEVGGENVRALRRDMKAHSALLNRLVEQGVPGVLPVRFGVVFPTPQLLLERFLKPQYGVLKSHLDRLRGTAEVKLKVTYDEQRVLREVVTQHPELAGRRAGSYQSKIDLGQRVASAIRAKQDRDAQWVLEALRPVVREVRLGQAGGDLSVLNASLLVENTGLPKFDRALEKLTAEAGAVMRFDCVGPLPPYSFAEIRL